ncbi:MAG TPA: YdeI/OmpD-associated family protein [Steroidobacteraceae bacterium]|nr:YdeI/OmpD-associated family protein [Steroidobacteraceae bacterium]
MKNPAVDAYIEKSADFARPILKRLRALMHKTCPKVEETMKWGVPHFEYKGVIAGMAAFKQHAAFGFWKQRLMKDPSGSFTKGESGMGGRKIRSVHELPSDTLLLAYIREAVALNEQGAKVPRPTRRKPPVKAPPYLTAALKKNAKARKTFENFSPSQQREYAEWLTDAKQEATRERRLATAIDWLSQGKTRNWKYQNC